MSTHMFRFEIDPDLVDDNEKIAREAYDTYGHIQIIVYAETRKQAEREFLKLWYVDEEDEEEGGWLD